MVKSCIHFITKIIVAVVVYILAFIAGILYSIDGLFRMISGAVSALPVACIGFLLSGAVTMTIYFSLERMRQKMSGLKRPFSGCG